MKIIGLTGGIASGKSLVANWFIDAGFSLIEADSVYKRLATPGGSLYQKLLDFVPPYCIDGNKQIDWHKLGQVVFTDNDFRVRLNQLTHPAVEKAVKIEIEQFRNAGEKYVVLSVPLLFESGTDKLCDITICVFVDQEVQTRRLMLRDQIPGEYAKLKIAAQMSLEEKRKLADYTIDNSGSVKETKKQFKMVLDALRSE